MSEGEIDSQILRAVRERESAKRELASIDQRITGVGRRLAQIAQALQAHPNRAGEDPLIHELRELEADVAAVLNADNLLETLEGRQQLIAQIARTTRYLREMGIPIAD